MPVPNTNTFSLIDVKNEIENNGGFPTNNLMGAFANATGTFDPNYVGIKDKLSNFRNYQQIAPATVFSFTMSFSGQSNAAGACNQSAGTLRFKTGPNGSVPGTGEVIYTSSAGTTRFNGFGLWFKSRVSGNDYSFLVSSTGVISSSGFCGFGGGGGFGSGGFGEGGLQ
jgi:hypothetical protein